MGARKAILGRLKRDGYDLCPMVRMILFDIDGTLIESDGAGAEAFERVFRSIFGVEGAAAELDFRGATDRGILGDFFKRQGIQASEANFEKFYVAYVHWLEQLLIERGGRTLPGTRRLLDELADAESDALVGLLTGNVRLGAEIKLRRFGIWDHFTTGAFGCERPARNDLAAIARERGSRLLGRELAGEEILIIGDTPKDIACGKSIGARVLAVATGAYTQEELEWHEADLVVQDLSGVTAAELLA